MATSTERRQAFEDADAISALEGLTAVADERRFDQAVIDGSMTHAEAVAKLVEAAKCAASQPGDAGAP